MSESHIMEVVGFVRDNGACGKYRVSQPLTVCDQLGYFKSRLIHNGDPTEKVIDHLSGAHVVVIPRPYDEMMLGMMERLKSKGVAVVIDHDDNMFHISPWSVHYQEFGTEEVSVDFNGEVKELWKDGLNIDLKLNRLRIDGFKRALAMADLITVTQPILAKVYREYNDNVVCLPNCVDPVPWQPLDLKKTDEVRLLWSGGSSHYQDVYILKDVLPALCKKYPFIKIVVMGCSWKAIFEHIPPHQFEYHDWVHVEAYPYKHASLNIDISMVPLEDNAFNRCKSHIKLVEQSFLRVPSVVSMVSPYREFYAGNNMVMVNNDDASWTEGLSRLIEDAELRRNIGRAAQKKAQEEYNAFTNGKMWAEAYAKVAQ